MEALVKYFMSLECTLLKSEKGEILLGYRVILGQDKEEVKPSISNFHEISGIGRFWLLIVRIIKILKKKKIFTSENSPPILGVRLKMCKILYL